MPRRNSARTHVAAAALLIAASAAPSWAQTTTPDQEAGVSKTSEVAALKQELAEQQKQIERLQAAMDELEKRLDNSLHASHPISTTQAVAKSAGLEEEASLTPIVPTSATATTALPAALPAARPGSGEGSAESPVSVKIGGAEFTPGGFLDFTTVFRSTNVGSGIGTSFGNIPFSGTSAGSLSETRFSIQNSRVSLAVTSMFKGFHLKGYVETDFLGNAPANVFVSTNSNTLRSRLYWIQARRGKFELLGGQSWSMLTPNRTGLSPNPSDIFYSQDMDTNYQAGLTWTRQAQFRLIYHPTDTIAAGVSIENPQQLVGASTVPSALASQVETGSGNAAAPNLAPDVIAKVAWDPRVGGRHDHVEVAGLLTSARIYDPVAKLKSTAEGGGLAANFNFELVKDLHAIVNTFWSDGGGRYIFGLGPQFIVNRDASGVYHPSLVHADSAVAGLEYQWTPQTMFYGYYGGAYFGRNFGIDCFIQPIPAGSPTGTTPTCNSTPSSQPSYIGFGYLGAPDSQNKSVQEGTFGVIQTFWKNPHYGALQLITQYSYLTRSPWVVSGPKDAHASMGYADLRYVLP